MLLYHNGPILTMTGQKLEAVLTDGGKIVGVGSYVNLQVPQAEEVDLEGRCLMPAFIDPHSHLSSLASSMSLCQLQGAGSFGELAARLKEYAARRPSGETVVGTGYDHTLLEEGVHPDRKFLDELFPDRPVLLSHASGHMGVVNSAALAMLGIAPDTPDPDGGKIGREDDGVTPNGYLEENAFIRLATKLPMPATDPMADLEKAQEVYLSHGITLCQDGLTTQAVYDLLSRADLTVDVVGYADWKNTQGLAHTPEWQGKGKFRLGGWKVILDGSPQGRTAWMEEPYEGEEDYRGYPAYTDGEVTDAVAAALTQNVQILAHCNGDAACAQFIRACRAAQEQVSKPVADIRPVMVHAQLARKEQLGEMAALGILPSFFLAHVYHWGDVHLRNFGPARAGRISPAATAQALGLPFTLHQDTPVLPPDMLETVWCAAARVTRGGVTLGPEEKLSVTDALKAVTLHAAYQYGLEGERGSIEVGKAADFVLLDRDPTAVEPEELRRLQVLSTIKDGKTVWAR